jgi:uncharacterized protein (DUF2235 family)
VTRKERNLVICLDGTGNSPTKYDTNVVRIFRLAQAMRGNIAYYDPGIGTLPRPGRFRLVTPKIGRGFGSASGHGMIEDIGQAYKFVSQTYQDGDRLFFFGFSRGAYTARLLASLIYQIGLLPPDHDNLVPYALNLALSGKEAFDKGKDGRCRALVPKGAELFSRKLCLRKPKVDFLGLFDCVKSAVFAIDAGWSPIRISVPFSWYNDDVLHVRHAMAIDEKRAFFPVNRWAENSIRPGTVDAGRTVKQVWFPGDHCDVGGSHTGDGLDLSVVPLVWMVKEATAVRLPLDKRLPLDELSECQKNLAADHKRLAALQCNDLCKGKWLLAELVPTYSANDDDQPRWRIPHWRRGRFIPTPARIHERVKVRLSSGHAANGAQYCPEFLRWIQQAEGRPEADRLEWIS